ncbi:MAG: MoaD/ThiS family protein [Aquabacterium sp.]
MPTLTFTPQLHRFLATPRLDSAATSLAVLLDEAFVQQPRLRGYVLDDQGHLRPNVVVFIDGQRSIDRVALTDALAPDSQVYVLQALSGG